MPVIVVQRTLPGDRLDTFLRTQFPTLSRGAVQRLIAEGCIRVNGERIKQTHNPKAGESITIEWPDARPSEVLPEAIPLQVIYEDSWLLVINKPPDVVVHPSAGHDEHTLVNALLHHCAGQLSGIGGVARPGIVHRLDKDTSGCLLAAKNDEAHLSLAAQFANRTVHKKYLAVICGELTHPAGEIRAAIARHPNHRQRMAVANGRGRPAWTTYRLLDQFKHSALVEATLHTGRTHQVRVHLKHIGHPIVGDLIYGKSANAKLAALEDYRAPRQLLHASELGFNHPRTQQWIACRAPLPLDFKEALENLGNHSRGIDQS